MYLHTDLDGVISGLLIKQYFEKSNKAQVVTVIPCSAGSYGNLNSNIDKVLNDPKLTITQIFITDLTPDHQMMSKLKSLAAQIKITIIDHHESSLPLAHEYNDLIINQPVVNEHPSCAATLVYDYLHRLSENDTATHKLLPRMLADITRSYDTWEWQLDANDKYGSQARDFDGLLYLYGKEIFIRHTLIALENGKLMSDEDHEIMQLHQQRNDTYINMKLKDVEYTTLQLPTGKTIPAAIVPATQLFSELGNAILNTIDPHTHHKCHLAIMISNHNVSLRSDEQIDCSKIAAYLNGGGHPKASGGQLNVDFVKLIQKALTV